MSALLKSVEAAADIAWEQHAANVALLRRVYLDPGASDEQRRRAAEMTARSERQFKDAFLALDNPSSEACDGDATILAAWAEWREPVLRGEEEAIHDVSRRREVDRIIGDALAVTPAGVACKLRTALYCEADSLWMMSLALGAALPDVEERMLVEDFKAQILWSSIKSLEQMEKAA